jgi:FxsC-like protein
MSGADSPQGRLGQRGTYFFLSYAHSVPLEGSPQTDPDRWVRAFFDDLSSSVQRHASPASQLDPGFFDQNIPLSSNWKTSLTRALSTAEVFVPLCSPSYFTRSWPGKEWAAFQQRVRESGLADPLRRFTPVLWIPLPARQDLPGLDEALAIGAPESVYAENGLRALLRLSPYRASYRLIVDRLAARIVELAETTPLSRSAAPDFDDVTSPFEPGPAAPVFTVIVAAPVRADLPAERDPIGYGDHGIDWRPYPHDQGSPLAEYAAGVAEQLDFAVQIRGIDNAGTAHSKPGVVLIDPWLVASDGQVPALEALVGELPPWVLPLLILDADDDEEGGGRLAGQVRAILGKATMARTEVARRAMAGVSSLRDFVSLMPAMIAEAERQYLRHGPVLRATSGGAPKPVLAVDGLPASPPSSPHSFKEDQPDAQN